MKTITTPTCPVNGGDSPSRAEELADAFATVDAAVASTPESHSGYEKLTGKKRTAPPVEADVEVSFTIPASLWEKLCNESRAEVNSTDGLLVEALERRYATGADLVPVFMPAWIAKRLQETADVIDLDGGVAEMLETELGCQLLGSGCSFHDVVLDKEGGTWDFGDDYAHVKATFEKMGERWSKEDEEREFQQAAAMEVGGAK